MLFFYNFIISIIALAANAASLFNNKVHEWLQFQKANWKNIKHFADNNDKKSIWVHCASIGEYEQVIPLVKIIKSKHPNTSVAVTFFSPSGVDFHKNNEEIDFIGFMPIDTKKGIQKWISILKPYKIIVVKNEWWPNMMAVHNIPIYHVCVNSLPKIPLNLVKSNGIHITDKRLQDQFKAITPNLLISPDTKIERALSVKNEEVALPEFDFSEKTIIYGSMWEEDASKLKAFINNHLEYKHIIFPHKIDKDSIDKIKAHIVESKNVIIVDKMGILKHAYKYADYIYIGGGFGNGVHNTIEALIYKKPIAIGPNIGANKELYDLLSLELIEQINGSLQFEEFINLFQPSKLEPYFKEQSNSSINIYNFIFNDD